MILFRLKSKIYLIFSYDFRKLSNSSNNNYEWSTHFVVRLRECGYVSLEFQKFTTDQRVRDIDILGCINLLNTDKYCNNTREYCDNTY